MEPAPQFSMLGDFRVEGVLGEGGSGIVYDATWGPRRVALKVLHARLLGTGKERAQFLGEAQRLQQITHPAVVKVLAVGQLPDGRPYLAMERLEGETLASVIARGALPLARAIPLFEELCSAVAALHEQGLVHRDLKPENVFVVAQKHAVLLDFGIAKDLAAPASTTTQEGNVRGTPAYMAPERFFGQPAGIATDVYELAVTLYMMLAGRLPWDDVADPETRLAPRSLAALAPDVPDALDVEIRRALSTRVQNRPASATALLDAVRTAVNETSDAGDAEPAPGSTARLRSGAHDAVGPTASTPADAAVHSSTTSDPTKPGHMRPVSANHAVPLALATTVPSVTAKEQQTPLAWAPTEAAPVATTTRTPRRRRIAIGAGIAVVAVAAGAFALLRTRDASTLRTLGGPYAATDPWGDHPASATGSPTPPASKPAPTPSASTLALVEKPLTAAQYRAEASAAIAKLPADTHLVATVHLTDLRANPQTSTLLDAFVQNPKVTALGLMLPGCVRTLLGDAEWFVFGTPRLETTEVGTLVVRGRWRRADVATCLGDSVRTHETLDGATLYRIADTGWLDFLDDHTAYITVNTKLDAERAHALTKKPLGPVAHTKQLLAALPAERSITFVADGKAGDDWSMLGLPTGTDVFAWVHVLPDGARLDLAADPHDVAAAQAAVDKNKPDIDSVFAKAPAEAVGKLEVVRDNTVVHIRGTLTSTVLSMVTANLGT